jgi:hypothetical protein
MEGSMFSFRKLCSLVALPMAVVMFLVSAPLTMVANAALVPTETIVGTMSAEQDRATVLNYLSREDVTAQFRALGVSPDEAQARVQVMSDEELRQVAGKLDQIPSGQSFLGFVIAVALITLLVLVITDAAGLTDVFPFVHPVK